MKHYPPARLSEITEAAYTKHVTNRAAALGIPEQQLSAHIEYAAALEQYMAEEVAS